MYTIAHREAQGSFENERDNLREVTFIQGKESLCSQFYCRCTYRANIFLCVRVPACVYMCKSLCVCACV